MPRLAALVLLIVLAPHLALAQRLAAYDNFTLVATPDGKVWSFGWDLEGQLGHDATPATVPNQCPIHRNLCRFLTTN